MGKQIAHAPYNPKPLPPTYDEATKVALEKELKRVKLAFGPILPRTVTGATTATVDDKLILADATSAAFTVTLPNPADVMCMEVTIKKIDVSAHAVTVGGTVDGVSNPTLPTQYKAMTVYSDGAAWWKIASV